MSVKAECMASQGKLTNRWIKALMSCAIVVFTITAFYYQTIDSLISVWATSETFAHGFIIAPISLWLIWDKRERLFTLVPTPAFIPLIAIFASGVGWALANVTGIVLVQQLAVVAIIIFSIWAILGHEVTKVISFPLFFLFFGVPMGEELIPGMMEFTADFTVALLQITGIPVFRDGLYFSLPTGNWSVVKACSGIRYLIASLTLGTVYAYLTYQTLYKRLLFILAAVIVPIFANGIRAYAIVMIGHLSGMELATGVDHLVYGWVFFGFLIAILFGLGSIWRESKVVPTIQSYQQQYFSGDVKPLAVFLPCVLSIALIVMWPSYVYIQGERTKNISMASLTLPDSVEDWIIIKRDNLPWDIHYKGYDQLVSAQYENQHGDRVFLSIVFYGTQTQGSELINSTNKTIRNKESTWKISQEVGRKIDNIEAKEQVLGKDSAQLIVWRRNWVNGIKTINNYYGKYLEAKSKILTGRAPAAAIFLATEAGLGDSGRELLGQFVLDTDEAIDQVLADASQ